MNHLCILAEFCVGGRSVTYSGHLGNLTWHQSSGHKRPPSELKDDSDIQHNFLANASIHLEHILWYLFSEIAGH